MASADAMPTHPLTILIADDAAETRAILDRHIQQLGFHTVQAVDGEEAAEIVRGQTADIALIDIFMPGLTGLDVLKAVRDTAPWIVAIMMTADPGVPMVVEAVKLGAYDFLTKPLDLNGVEVTIRQAAEKIALKRQVQVMSERLSTVDPVREIVARSAGMKRVLRQWQYALHSNATTLLLGESGTGKSILARALHRLGPRGDGPFVIINCAAIPDHLLESELFGHERGAFTGATERRIGKFEAAHQGVLFLDEIGDMPMRLQSKLLQVLQERRITRLGSNQEIPVDVRVIAATNTNLHAALTEGSFREDLYYRLAVLELEIPPLRERREDIGPLAQHFLAQANVEEGKSVTDISPEALAVLEAYDFPGNVRQLENIVTRAVVMASGTRVTVRDLPAMVQAHAEACGITMEEPPEPPPERVASTLEFVSEDDIPALAELEVAVMRRAVDVCGGNMTKAARRLRIGRATIYRRLFNGASASQSSG